MSEQPFDYVPAARHRCNTRNQHKPPGMAITSNESPQYSDDEREFLVAIQRYKEERRRPFPTWCEVLAVAMALGYRKVAERTALPDFRDGPRG